MRLRFLSPLCLILLVYWLFVHFVVTSLFPERLITLVWGENIGRYNTPDTKVDIGRESRSWNKWRLHDAFLSQPKIFRGLLYERVVG